MSGSLVTVARFYDPLKAALVKNYLEAAGVRCFPVDEEIVATVWQYAQAVGGIKLQVAREDARRAQALMSGEGVCEDLAIHDDSFDSEDEAVSLREQHAERAFRAAVLGLLFLPLQVYVSCLLVKVFLSDEALAARSRRRAWIACLINLPFVIGFLGILGLSFALP